MLLSGRGGGGGGKGEEGRAMFDLITTYYMSLQYIDPFDREGPYISKYQNKFTCNTVIGSSLTQPFFLD